MGEIGVSENLEMDRVLLCLMALSVFDLGGGFL